MDAYPWRPLSTEPYFNSCQRQTFSSLWPESEKLCESKHPQKQNRWSGWKVKRIESREGEEGGWEENFTECLKSPLGHGVLTEDWHTVKCSIQPYTHSFHFLCLIHYYITLTSRAGMSFLATDTSSRLEKQGLRDMTGLWDRCRKIWQPFHLEIS